MDLFSSACEEITNLCVALTMVGENYESLRAFVVDFERRLANEVKTSSNIANNVCSQRVSLFFSVRALNVCSNSVFL